MLKINRGNHLYGTELMFAYFFSLHRILIKINRNCTIRTADRRSLSIVVNRTCLVYEWLAVYPHSFCIRYIRNNAQCIKHHCDMQFTSFSLNNDATVQTVHSFVKCVALNKMGQFGIVLWYKLRCTWNWMQFHECSFMNAISSKNLLNV